MLDDVRYAGRLFRRTPGFTAGAVLTIALAVGSNVAVFSALYGALLRPLPVADGDRLVVSYLVDRELRQDTRAVSHVVFDAWRAQARTLTSIAAVAPYRFDLTGDGAARRVEAGVVSGALFETLGVTPALGRTFTEATARESGEPACVISDSLWQARFGGDAGVLGRRISAGDLSFVIVGVMPRSFDRWRGLAEMWVPVDGVPHFSAVKNKPGYYSYHVIGRLQDGVTPAAAAAELTSLSAPIETNRRSDDASRHGVNVRLLREDVIGQTPRRMLLSLAVVVALVWVIAVVNIASLLLARNVERSREFAVRSAIGGTRWHVLRQLLVESVLLASTGAAAGLLVARWVVDLLRTYGPPALAREGLVAVDMTSAGLAALGALLTTVVIGVLPAIGPLRLPAYAVLLKSNPATSSSWLQDSFVGLQVAFTTMVVIGTISVGQAFWTLKQVDMGYDAGAVMTMRVSFPTRYFDENQPKLRQALQQLEQHVAAVPGVRHVALGDVPVPYPYAPWSFTIERGRRFLNGNPKDRPLAPGVHFVSSDYQRTLDIRLLSGRELLPDDIAEGRPVAVISRTMAHLHWQDQDPIGRRITFGRVGRDGVSTEPWFTIVGVVTDVRYGNPEAAIGPQVYVPVSLSQGREVSVLARTSGDPIAASAALQQAVQTVDPDIAVYDARTLSDRLAETTAESRYRTGMLVFFGGLALLLAATGLHGATAGRVAKRRRELALRIAIGATPRGLVRLVLRRTLMVVAIASTAGAIAALLAARWAASRVWGLIETDAAGMSAAIVVVLMIGAMAALVPALRAGRVDPMAVLRSE